MPFEEVTIGSARLIRGDCREILSKLPAESVHCCVTSPPYFGLRDYNVAGQLGLEKTPAEYISTLVAVFREVRRVLRPDGTLWLNIGDSYASGGRQSYDADAKSSARGGGFRRGNPEKNGGNSNRDGVRVPGFKPKDLLGIPWMLAFALRDDGWYLRRDIIWHKPNPMPESVTDRPTTAHEYLFLLTKSPAYYYDAEAIKEPCSDNSHGSPRINPGAKNVVRNDGGSLGKWTAEDRVGGRNKRSVWTITTAPFKGAHFATFPPALVEPCILAGTSERGVCPKCGSPWERVIDESHQPDIPGSHTKMGVLRPRSAGRHHADGSSMNNDPAKRPPSPQTIGWRPTCSCKAKGIAKPTVIDPFGGAATTALTASKLGRSGISIELSAAYHDIACERIAKTQNAEAA